MHLEIEKPTVMGMAGLATPQPYAILLISSRIHGNMKNSRHKTYSKPNCETTGWLKKKIQWPVHCPKDLTLISLGLIGSYAYRCL